MTQVAETPRRRRKTIAEDGPDPVDVHVGRRLRLRRTLLGMSQDKLAGKMGVSFQQVQKYERGANRISAGRLYLLTQILDVPITFFFDDLTEETPKDGQSDDDHMGSREALELVRAYYAIPDVRVRKRFVDLMRELSRM